jgi:hypothetical protein
LEEKIMRKMLKFGLFLTLLLSMFLLYGSVSGQVDQNALEYCREGAFSTEEDFVTQGPEPPDGNPIISDGDLLSMDGRICARNQDLTQQLDIQGEDLGLDAVDILDFSTYLVAFSTELDSSNVGQFTAGDLLFTNGGIVPNYALVEPFGIQHDIGLDAVHFIGAQKDIESFVDIVLQTNYNGWGNGLLQDVLARYNLDIWFSVEGTEWLVGAPSILDGDLLSAASGTVVASNAVLLDPSVPAGIPVGGVDFGLDAITSLDVFAGEIDTGSIFFSTEILYRGDLTFTDGDILKSGNGVIRTNEDLVKQFEPKADFLGLDALWAPVTPGEPPKDPNIQTLCGRPVVDFDGGIVTPSDTGTGLYRANMALSPPGDPPRQPCGEYVPIDGFLPDTNVTRFRVAYRPYGTALPAPGIASGVRTNWKLKVWHGWPINACLPTSSLNTDSDGWMDASDYLGARDGTLTGCVNSGFQLAVWDTADHHVGFGPSNPNGHYILWLEWEDGGGILHQEAYEHHVQLDNTLPTINDFQITLSDGTTPVGACGEAPPGESTFKVFGDFDDLYSWGYKLRVRGGNPPKSQAYGWHNYYDGTPPVANTDSTGTNPAATTVFLRDIYMTDLGTSFTDCCYVLDLWVRDAAIRYTFNGITANDATGSDAWWDNTFLTFAAAP